MKKRIVCMMVLCLLVAGAGCLPDEIEMHNFTKQVVLLSDKVDAYQAEMGEVVNLLEADNILSKEIVEKIDKTNEEIDRIQPKITEVAIAIRDAEYVSGDDAGNIIKGAKAGTAATASWNPYAAPMLLGLNLLEGVLLLILRRKKNRETKKRNADKVGREKTLREIATVDEGKLTAAAVKSLMFNNIGEARKGI